MSETSGRARAARGVAALVLAVCGGLLWLGDRSLPAVRAAEGLVKGEASPFVCSFRARTGVPCVGCGGTTAFGHASRGRVVEALRANPLGAFAGASAWLLLVVSGWTLVIGRGALLVRALVAVALLAPLVFVWTAVVWWLSLPAGAAAR